jgi:hypothetical protein
MFLPSSTLPPVVFDADPAQYHAPQKARRGDHDFVMSRSELWEFTDGECPLEWRIGKPREVTAAMKWGDLTDVLILTPERFEECFEIIPETYKTMRMKCPKCGSITDAKSCKKCGVDRVETEVIEKWNWNSTTCEQWEEKVIAAGKRSTKAETVSHAQAAVKQFFAHPHLKAFHEVSRKQVQVNVEWHDEDTGIVVPFKCMLDLVPDPASEFGDTLADLKQTWLIRYRDWQRNVHREGLDVQAAVYLDAMNAASGLSYSHFEFHLQKSEQPWIATHRMLSPDFLLLGRNRYQDALKSYCRCVAENTWRGYDAAMIEPLPYMI